MTRIRLFRTAQGWMIRSDDPEVHRLFGTDTLPCAYTAEASAEMVLAEIRRLNPQDEYEEHYNQVFCALDGWYWVPCLPGVGPDGKPTGPFATEGEAWIHAERNTN